LPRGKSARLLAIDFSTSQLQPECSRLPFPMVTPSRSEEFLACYSGCEGWLFAYLMTLLGNREDAEEVFQETTLALWRSFDDFTPGTDFSRWAKKIAFYRVLTYRKQKKRLGIPQSEEFLAAIHSADERQIDGPERLRALNSCVEKLSQSDRQIVSLRYTAKKTVPQLAAHVGRPANTVSKALIRIRRALLVCIERTLARGEAI
jgi:RNA polymerase sigma-70 factor, ECF subfamily